MPRRERQGITLLSENIKQGVEREFQRAMGTDEVCGRPLDSFACRHPCYRTVSRLGDEGDTI